MERLQTLIEAKDFYQYVQLVRTFFFKFKMRKRIPEMKQLLEKGYTDLKEHEQKDLVVELLELYYVEYIRK